MQQNEELKCDKQYTVGKRVCCSSAGGSFHLPNSVHEEATIWPTKEDKKAMISNANSAWWC